MSHMKFATLALAVAALATAGCGGSSKTSSTSSAAERGAANPKQVSTTAEVGKTPESGKSTAAFIAEADAICATSNTQIESGVIRHRQDFARVVPQDAIYFRAESQALQKLTPPPSLAADWKEIVDGFARVSSNLATFARYTRSNTLEQGGAYFHTANKVREHVIATAARDGFKDCARVHR